MTTSHVDLHGEIMHPKALKGLARQIREQYMSININHDIRYPPIGRVVSSEVIKLQDGEYALQGTLELFEESDSLESLIGDGRKIPIKDQDIQTIAVECDRTFRDKEGQELLRDLSQISGGVEKPIEILKKALEPVSTLLIIAGIFVVGSIAKGFFSKLGSDAYDGLKGALAKYYRRSSSSEHILDFCFLVKQQNINIEVHVLIVNPSEQKLNELFISRFNGVDAQLVSLPLTESDIAKVVFEYKNQRLLMCYAVRCDSVPLMFERAQEKGGNGS